MTIRCLQTNRQSVIAAAMAVTAYLSFLELESARVILSNTGFLMLSIMLLGAVDSVTSNGAGLIGS